MKVSRKIGLMGGTFNPPHMGHLLLAEWAKEEASLDEIVFIPAGNPYMKEGKQIASGEDRLEMVRLAILGQTDFVVSDIEISRTGYTYTCDTLEQLCREHPENQYYFIMGADCLFAIENWYAPERIFASCIVIAAARGNSPMEELEQKRLHLTERFGAKIMLLHFPDMELSSTEIRERIRNGKSIRYMVPDNVMQYIQQKKIYG